MLVPALQNVQLWLCISGSKHWCYTSYGMMSKRSRWPKCPGQKWPTRSSDEDFPCLIAFFITRCCLWKLTFVVEGTANVISALSWHHPCWDFTNEKLTQNLRPEQKSLKYTNLIQYEIFRSEQNSCEYTNASATASASLSEQKMQLQLVLHGGLSGNIFASWIDL